MTFEIVLLEISAGLVWTDSPVGLGVNPTLHLSPSHYIFAGRIAFSNKHFYLLSNTGTVVIIEILADVYAAKVKNAVISINTVFQTLIPHFQST